MNFGESYLKYIFCYKMEPKPSIVTSAGTDELELTSQCLFQTYRSQTPTQAAVEIIPDEVMDANGVLGVSSSTLGSLDGVQEGMADMERNKRARGGPVNRDAQQTVESHVAMLSNDDGKG